MRFRSCFLSQSVTCNATTSTCSSGFGLVQVQWKGRRRRRKLSSEVKNLFLPQQVLFVRSLVGWLRFIELGRNSALCSFSFFFFFLVSWLLSTTPLLTQWKHKQIIFLPVYCVFVFFFWLEAPFVVVRLVSCPCRVLSSKGELKMTVTRYEMR